MIELPKALQLQSTLVCCRQYIAAKMPEPERTFVLATLEEVEAELGTMQQQERNNKALLEQLERRDKFVDLMERQLALLQKTLEIEEKYHEA